MQAGGKMTKEHRVLIAGWYSFDTPHNTAGDLLAQQVAIKWMEAAGHAYRIAVATPQLENEVATESLFPDDYSAVVFVCGPITNGHVKPFINKFPLAKKIALNVSVIETADLSNDFDVIIARDSATEARPDISLATTPERAPVVGLIYVGKQKEYPTQQHQQVEELVDKVLTKLGAARVMIDTKIPNNEYGLQSIAQIESVMSRMDAVVTTRLHGSVLTLLNGVPVVAIDSVPEGAKVSRQMAAIGWPLAYKIGELDEAKLEQAIRVALSGGSKAEVVETIHRASTKLEDIRKQFIRALEES
jgi:hypothetical protein